MRCQAALKALFSRAPLEMPTAASNQDAKSRDPSERIQFGFMMNWFRNLSGVSRFTNLNAAAFYLHLGINLKYLSIA